MEATHEAASYPARQNELTRLEREVSAEARQADRIERRTKELDLLTRLWDVLERKKAAEQRLVDWQGPTPNKPGLGEQVAELQSLRSTCSGHLERQNQLGDLCNQRAGIEQSIETALGSLGSSWDRDRVRSRSRLDRTDRRGPRFPGLRSPSWNRAGGPRACWPRRPTPCPSSPACSTRNQPRTPPARLRGSPRQTKGLGG